MPRDPQAGDFWEAYGTTYYCVGRCPKGFHVWMKVDKNGEDKFGRFEAERFSQRVLLNVNHFEKR